MLARIRQFAKSWVALLLIGLLIVSFAVIQQTDAFQSSGGNSVVQAGDRKVSGPEFRTIFERWRDGAQQQSGQTFTAAEAVERGVHLRLLEELGTIEATNAALAKMGVRPSDTLVLQQIRQLPDFFDPVTGRFDQQAYESTLARNQFTRSASRPACATRSPASTSDPAWWRACARRASTPPPPSCSRSESRDLSLVLVHPGLVEQVPRPPTPS
jgi:peptidyl-prolyl cis-trans isomerase D